MKSSSILNCSLHETSSYTTINDKKEESLQHQLIIAFTHSDGRV
jgi:hypothetical protein